MLKEQKENLLKMLSITKERRDGCHEPSIKL